MKLTNEEYEDIARTWSKEEADRVSKLKGWKSVWYQMNYEYGPYHKEYHTIVKMAVIFVISAIIGAIPFALLFGGILIVLLIAPFLIL